MKDLLKYLKNYKMQSILAPFFKMLEAIFELIVPLVMARIIDCGIKNQDTAYVLKMGGILILLAVVGVVCSITAQFFAAKAATGFAKELRRDLFSHINRLSYPELDKLGASTLITRMTSDVNQIQSGVNMFLRLFLRSPFVFLGAIIMAFLVDVKVSMIFLIIFPLLCLVVFYITFKSLPLYKDVQGKLDKVTLLTRENLSGARVIRAFNHEKKEREAFDRSTKALMNASLKVGRLSAFMNPVTYLIINMGIVAILWRGGIRVNAGSLSQGDVVALINYMTQILVELIKFANLIVTITKALASADRIAFVFKEKPSVTFSADDIEVKDTKNNYKKNKKNKEKIKGNPVVEFDNVSIAYPGVSEEALSDLSFKAYKGEIIGIIGGTGSGKTTLVNLIPGFYKATKGRVLIDGKDVFKYDKKELRSKIGIVLQKAVLFKGTIRDNMKWGKPDATDEEINKALEIAQAKSFVDEKDKGLDFVIEQGTKNLSGGQKQRLTIARAIVRHPKILILDDSSSALDFATDAALRKAIRTNCKDETVFIVSQRASSIRYADKIIVLDDGNVCGIGSHEELLKSSDVYKDICLSQMNREEA